MSTSRYLLHEVERILLVNDTNLKSFMKGNLATIASNLRAKGLVEHATAVRMSQQGVNPMDLAVELLDAFRTSLMQHPEERFPKFIAVLKEFVTMKELAEKMEDDFKKASMS